MNRVLVTTDFSELGDVALAPAAMLASKLGAKLTIAHILGGEKPPEPDPKASYYTVAKRLFEADRELETQTLASLEERAKALPGDPAISVARGAPVQGILELAERLSVDLIIISSQGRTGLSRILLGSVAEELARVSTVPVLIWKEAKAEEG